jgi:DNA-binding transcriptional LysR family regulator
MDVGLAILIDVDLHLVRTFMAVARSGSFSRAARDLGYTQSAVSQHIAALEHDLGAVLLHRRPVAPTAIGARLLEHAGPLLLRLDAARADIARLTASPSRRLAIGAAPLAMTPALAGALTAFRLRHPSVAVTVRVLGRGSVVTAVTTGALDMGLVDGIAAPNDPLHLSDIGSLATVAVAQQPLAVALPAAHPLARRAGLRLTDLADAWWIDAPDTAISLDQMRRASGSDGYQAHLRYEGADVRGLVALAAAGGGLALLPLDAIDRAPGIAAVRLSAPRLVHRTELLHRSTGDDPAALLAAVLTAAPG